MGNEDQGMDLSRIATALLPLLSLHLSHCPTASGGGALNLIGFK